MISYIGTFIALFLTDFFYTYYLRSVRNDEAVKASSWAVAIFLCSCVGVINYTEDHLALIPAVLGAFLGTYMGIKRK